MRGPTRRGHELTIGNHIGDAIPDCCGRQMTPQAPGRNHRLYACGCGSTVKVDRGGLVAAIND